MGGLGIINQEHHTLALCAAKLFIVLVSSNQGWAIMARDMAKQSGIWSLGGKWKEMSIGNKLL